MKKTFLILLLFISALSFLSSLREASAQEASPTPSDQNTIQKKITDLKERLATRVAELKTQNKKAFYGVVKQKQDGKITLMQDTVEMNITYDPTTKISIRTAKGTKEDTKDTMLVIGSNVVAFGTLDLDQKILAARTLFIHEQPHTYIGSVKSIDTKEGSFIIETEDGPVTLDYEISTKCRIYDGDGLASCGLSKIKQTDKVVVRMTPGNTEETRGTALRILVLPTVAAPDAVSPTSTKPKPTQ